MRRKFALSCAFIHQHLSVRLGFSDHLAASPRPKRATTCQSFDTTLRLCCAVPIPEFTSDSNGCYLPAGDHAATLAEIEVRFATNHRRREIFKGLVFVVERLRERGVTEIWVDGSFVTA